MAKDNRRYIQFYTPGSTAIKVDIQDEQMWAPLPEPKPEKKAGYVCRVCGYVYEGEPLPKDFVCPICLHGADDFEPLGRS